MRLVFQPPGVLSTSRLARSGNTSESSLPPCGFAVDCSMEKLEADGGSTWSNCIGSLEKF